MGPGKSRLLIWTVPTVAILFSILWYKRKNSKRQLKPKEIIQEAPQTPVKTEEIVIKKEVSSPQSSPQRLYCRSLSGVESAPIDIKTNKTPPLILSDQELDLEIEKMKSMKSLNYNTNSSASSSNSSVHTQNVQEIAQEPICAETIKTVEPSRDSANHSPAEAMLASPSCSIASDSHHSDSDSGKGGSDVATPPPPKQSTQTCPGPLTTIHEFLIPQQLVGRLIGRQGAFVHLIKDKTNAHILIKRHPEGIKNVKVCAVEGTREEIDAALDMIREKFPEKKYPDVTLEHVVFADTTNAVSLVADCMYLKLIDGINNDTILSCMVSPRHLFLQQPTHPTFPSLNVLTAYMNACYNDDTNGTPPPLLPTPILENTICAAYSIGTWCRASVESVDEQSNTCYVRFLDFGGYATLETTALRQIRGDFLLLPFQAAECLLAGVQPQLAEDGTEIWPQEAYDLVVELTKSAVVFTQVVDYTETGVPLVYIYIRGPNHVIFLNKELVNRGLANWSLDT